MSHLNREEYIEQAYFFRTFLERVQENIPSQEVLESVREEILATTKLPMAIDFLRGEILLTGNLGAAMAKLDHYFRPFQAYVMSQADDERSRFDQKVALDVLQREAEYLAEEHSPAGLFVYQFESIARNRLGYDGGMTAMAADPHFSPEWSEWILKSRLRLGTTDFADMIFYRSQHFVNRRRRQPGREDYVADFAILFGEQEGRIALANRGKDPLFMFAALQRQLGHPSVPRALAKPREAVLHPALEMRLQRLEARIQLLESESKGELDLSEYLAKPVDFAEIDDFGEGEA